MLDSCILSHGDADGVCSAAIAKMAFPKAGLIFARPVSLRRDLRKVEAGLRVIVCDIALNEVDLKDLFQEFLRLSFKAPLIYIDHHPLPPQVNVSEIPVTEAIHDVKACSSELTYHIFKYLLRSEALSIAIYGAIGDYMDRAPFINSELKRWVRRTLYLEASLLVQALTEKGVHKFREEAALQLAQGKSPSEVQGFVEEALKGLKHEYEVLDYVRRSVERRENIAIVTNLPVKGFAGEAAIYARALTNAKVGVCANVKKSKVDMSLRAWGPHIDLNVIIREIAKGFDGSGGGHAAAAGAYVPSGKFEAFLEALDKRLGLD